MLLCQKIPISNSNIEFHVGVADTGAQAKPGLDTAAESQPGAASDSDEEEEGQLGLTGNAGLTLQGLVRRMVKLAGDRYVVQSCHVICICSAGSSTCHLWHARCLSYLLPWSGHFDCVLCIQNEMLTHAATQTSQENHSVPARYIVAAAPLLSCTLDAVFTLNTSMCPDYGHHMLTAQIMS